MTFLTTVLAESTSDSSFPTIIFGLIAFVVFLILGGVVFSYRDVANRHAAQAEAYAAKHSGTSEHGGH